MSRIVLVTGGTSGIGAATAAAFKESGYTVCVSYGHNEEAAQKFYKETGIPVYKWDIADPESCMNGVKKVAADLGDIEILVNNAGIARDATLQKMSVEEWKSVIDTDLGSCFNMARALIGPMKEKKFGRIINLSSVNGIAGQFGQTNYAAAKAGIIGFTKSLALETARKGITVNAVAPGYTDTHMMDKVEEKILQSILEKVPVGRLARPEEIARAILFLADEYAGFFTGETLSVNGGLYMQ